MILEYSVCVAKLIILFAVMFVLLFHLLFDVMTGAMFYYYSRDTYYLDTKTAMLDTYKVARFFKPIIKTIYAVPCSNNCLLVRGSISNWVKHTVKMQ